MYIRYAKLMVVYTFVYILIYIHTSNMLFITMKINELNMKMSHSN